MDLNPMPNPFATILNEVRAAFAQPDPMRFASLSVPPPNWFGELERKVDKSTGAILVNKDTNTYEFGRTRVEIPEHLTDLDIKGLQNRKLDPTNPAYAKAKAYFSKMPFCTKEDLAANSSGPDHEGIKPNTAKDVLGAFRAFLVDKPTF
jgi:hypothetical protein